MSDYKPITGELRKYATVSWDPWPDARDRLYQMCDRIDAIHAGLERENAELRAARGDDWIKLPVDADGLPIHVGDVMEWIDLDGEVTVTCSVDAVGVDCFFAWDKGNRRYAQKCANAYRHHHTPTVEDVLREFAYGLGVPVADSYIAASAAKLRLAEGEDA